MALSAEEDRRRNLVPKWIRVFCWIFLVAGALAPMLLVVGLFYTRPMQFGLFGWDHQGSAYDIFSLLVQAYFAASGVAAFGLLRGKPWGLAAGLMVGLVGLAISLGSLVAHPLIVSEGGSYSINFRLEPVLQIPYLYALWRIRNAWNPDDAGTAAGWTRTGQSLLVTAIVVGIGFVLVLHATYDTGATGATAGAPHFENIVVSDSKFGDAVEYFTTRAPVIYVHGKKAGIANGSTIRASWFAVDASGVPPNTKIMAKDFVDDLPANATLYFSLSKPTKGWPVGTYRLDLTIDDKPVGTATASVRAD